MDSGRSLSSSIISLLAFNKAEMQRDSSFMGFTTYTDNATWDFDANTNTVTIYYAHGMLKEFRKIAPEEYAEFGYPERFECTSFKILRLSENQMEIEELAANP